MKNKELRKKLLLLIEDEVMETIREPFNAYRDEIEIKGADNAGMGRKMLLTDFAEQRPDVLILDLMMPYGEVAEELDAASDPGEIETGVRLLKCLREYEREQGWSPIWVAVVTARSNPDLMERLEKLLTGCGRIYTKPFSSLELENDIATVLGIESHISLEHLPEGYTPPIPVQGDAL